MSIYTISNSNGINGPDWRTEYDSVESAAEAIRHAYRWSGVVMSQWFSDIEEIDGETVEVSSCCVYETQEKCDRDDEGAHAPRIHRHKMRD